MIDRQSAAAMCGLVQRRVQACWCRLFRQGTRGHVAQCQSGHKHTCLWQLYMYLPSLPVPGGSSCWPLTTACAGLVVRRHAGLAAAVNCRPAAGSSWQPGCGSACQQRRRLAGGAAGGMGSQGVSAAAAAQHTKVPGGRACWEPESSACAAILYVVLASTQLQVAAAVALESTQSDGPNLVIPCSSSRDRPIFLSFCPLLANLEVPKLGHP